MEKLKYRMYSLTNMYLSSIQKGIQTQHSASRYQRDWNTDHSAEQTYDNYNRWIDFDETTIVLDGGGLTNMKKAIQFLIDHSIPHTIFREPELNDCPTAVTFLLDERIWDKEKYPEQAEPTLPIPYSTGMGSTLEIIPAIYKQFDQQAFVNSIGGQNNYEVRMWLKGFRLAI